ncbi:hypothetical protein BK026_01470 [Alteromonas sp. V450]|uniref:hypothetical protein n=1 Tax=Alteromonas sp. V450 TaxID=1912139 RepID=UPI0008FF0F31|nr:hypothetical protein [Alteromonas sp. V450]OJF67567.1 hypothetical protein BK026_01470 [Alteromonas sp. V450]
MSKQKTFEFNPFVVDEKLPLHKLSAFWLPIIIFLTPAIALALPYFCLCWPETSNYDLLLKQLGFPTFIASLCLPLTVAVGRFHGSKQRAKANNLTESNNTFNHYYSHRQHFVDYLKTKESSLFNDIIVLNDAYLLYSFIFDKNSETEVTFNLNFNNVKERLKSYYIGQLSVRRLEVFTRLVETSQMNGVLDNVLAPLGLSLDWSRWYILVNERLDQDKFEAILVERVVDLFVAITSFSSTTDTHIDDPFKLRSDTTEELRRIVRSTNFHEEYVNKFNELLRLDPNLQEKQ